MTRWLLAALLLACACKSKAAAPREQAPIALMPAAEVQRSHDACKAYVDHVCACAATVPAMKHDCELAPALGEAVRIGLDVAANPVSAHDDALQAQDSVRKTVKQCIEQTAKLPTLGCP